MEAVKKDLKKSTWVDEYRINWYDADVTGRLTLPALCGLLEESAWRHANHLGVGWSEANKQHNAWVLVRLQLQVDEWPKWNQTIRVVTWSRGVDKLFAYRDFKLEDMRGRVLIHVTSTWLVLDIESRRPVRPDLVKDALSYAVAEKVMPQNAAKLVLPKITESSLIGTIAVSYPDLDLNGHTNNIRYPEWVLRFLPDNLLREKYIRSFLVNYLAESHSGDEISLFASRVNDTFCVAGIRKSDEKTVFVSSFEF